VCPLEANRVSARFAAPGEGQEEPQEAGSQEKKARISLDSSRKSSALEGHMKHNLLGSATVRVFDE